MDKTSQEDHHLGTRILQEVPGVRKKVQRSRTVGRLAGSAQSGAQRKSYKRKKKLKLVKCKYNIYTFYKHIIYIHTHTHFQKEILISDCF